MIIQFCGMSGSGKTTLAEKAKESLNRDSVDIEVIDGDEYRKIVCPDLGYSKADRNSNIRRLAFIASRFSKHRVVPIICAINPYEDIRNEIAGSYGEVKTIYIKCSLEELIRRDTKGLYKKAMLPEGHPEKISNLTGFNDPFEVPQNADLVIETDKLSVEASLEQLINYIKQELKASRK